MSNAILTQYALDWLENRGLEPEVVSNLGVHSSRLAIGEKGQKPWFEPVTSENQNNKKPENGTRYGKGVWLTIPYKREGVVLNNKHRRLDEKDHRQDAGSEKLVWNEDVIGDPTLANEPLIITEGEFDAFAALQCGYGRVISVPDGAPPLDKEGNPVELPEDSKKFSYLAQVLALLKKHDRPCPIVLAVDTDPVGLALREELSMRLGVARCMFLRYPKGCKDLNDTLINFEQKGVDVVFKRAKFIPVAGVYKPSEMPHVTPLQIYKAGFHPGFDERVSICLRHVSFWSGLPGHGKSALVNAVKIGLSQAYGLRHGVLTFESDFMGGYRTDVATYLADKPQHELQQSDYDAADAFLEKYYMVIQPDVGKIASLEWILEMAEVAVIRGECNCIWIDPWSKIDHDFKGLPETSYIAEALKYIETFAHKFNVHVGVVAHPRKVTQNQNGSFPVPTGYDISGSAHFYNSAYLGVSAYREDKLGNGVTRVKVWKSKRHSEMGEPGDVLMTFNKFTGHYDEYVKLEDHITKKNDQFDFDEVA